MNRHEIQSEIYRLASMIGEPAPSIRSSKDMVQFFNHFDQAWWAKLKAIHIQELIRAERLLRAVLSPTEYGDWRKEKYKPNEELTKKFRSRVRWAVNAKAGAKSRANAGNRSKIVGQLAITPPGPGQANTIAKRVGCTPHEVRRVKRAEKRQAAEKNGPIGLALSAGIHYLSPVDNAEAGERGCRRNSTWPYQMTRSVRLRTRFGPRWSARLAIRSISTSEPNSRSKPACLGRAEPRSASTS